MAEVFLAVAVGVEGFQRSVVIKRILPHLLEDRAFVNMFIDEAKLCGVLSHPNIVQIFEFGKVRDSFFIAMEHVRGRTLSAVQARLNRIGGQAPIATSLEVMRQVCLGLDYAHGLRSASGQPLGIVHRDVSPSNLMLGLHGGVKILDFGIARVAEELRETHTQVGTMKGKVSYMSPEQARLEPVDNRSDIFSVGIVLHELLTGHRLFKTSSERPSTHLLQEMPVAPPSFANPEVAPEIDRIVMRALAHDPDARFQTAGEMASEIGRLLRDMRAPPDGPERLLGSLFPHEPARSGEVDLALPFAPRFFGDSGSGTSRVSSARTSVGGTPQPSLEVGSGASASADRQYAVRNPAPARRWWIVAGAAALAAIAAAVSPETPAPPAAAAQPVSYGDVTVRPIAQKPSLFPDPEAPRPEVIEPITPPETFIPQAAERPPVRAPRMPKFEDLPMPAQAEIRQSRGEPEEEHPQKGRLSLLQRLANVGLGRRDEETEPPVAGRASGPAMPAMPAMPPLPERKPQRTVAQQIAANEPVSEYARRPAPQGLDTHGRPAPVAPAPQGDDHLDIPAFLRRQSN